MMKGSAKQVIWAESIVAQFIARQNESKRDSVNPGPGFARILAAADDAGRAELIRKNDERNKSIDALIEKAKGLKSAKAIIDNRDDLLKIL